MNVKGFARYLLASILGAAIFVALSARQGNAEPLGGKEKLANPVFHFEIPVTDIDRAVRFYEVVLGTKLTRRTVDGYEMAFFPRSDGAPGASGALAKGEVYVPSKAGAIIYFDVPEIDTVLERAKTQGADILYPKTHTGDDGYVAEIEDSEGNRIALTSTGK